MENLIDYKAQLYNILQREREREGMAHFFEQNMLEMWEQINDNTKDWFDF